MKKYSDILKQRLMSLLAIFIFFSAGTTLQAKTYTIQFGGALGDVYSPSTLTVSRGDTIQWVGDFNAHALGSKTIPAGAASFTKGTGTSFAYVPTIAGVYNYECLYHFSLGMIGSFTVLATGVELSQTPIVPSAYELDQNYPNPFNPTTIISFRLPVSAFTTLKIFNMIGQEVATLVSEALPAGTYRQQWNAANMPSGFYFYRLHAGSFTDTKRLVLVR